MATSASDPQTSTLTRVRDCALITALAVFGPYVVHLVPSWDDTPIGARLIPIFYAPLLGVFWRQYGFTLALAFASPWINHALFDTPVRGLATLLSIELLTFALFLVLLTHRWGRRAWMGPAAYLATKPFSAALLAAWPLLPVAPVQFIASSVTTAWPGIVVLALIGFFAARGPHQAA